MRDTNQQEINDWQALETLVFENKLDPLCLLMNKIMVQYKKENGFSSCLAESFLGETTIANCEKNIWSSFLTSYTDILRNEHLYIHARICTFKESTSSKKEEKIQKNLSSSFT